MLTKFVKEEKGFTLIELLIVVAIIGILAAIAIPQFSAYKARSYNASAVSDVRNAYTAAQVAFSDGVATVDLAALVLAGFVESSDVTTAVTAAKNTETTLEITSVHASGTKTYTIDVDGKITDA